MVTFHLLSSSVRYGCWSRGNAGRSLPRKSNGVVSEYTAQWYARSEGCKLGHIRLVSAKWQGWKKEGLAHGALSNACGTSIEVDYSAYTAAAVKLWVDNHCPHP